MIFDNIKRSAEDCIKDLLETWMSSEFGKFYKEILSHHKQFLSSVQQEKLEPKNITHAHQKFSSEIKNTIAKTDIGSLYVSIHGLKGVLSSSVGQNPLLKQSATEIIGYLDKVWDILNNISRLPSQYNLILQLIKFSEDIENIFKYFDQCKKFLNITHDMLLKDIPVTEEESGLSLIFSAEIITLSEFIVKLKCIKEIYSETCFLFQLEKEHENLKIAKIESGSFFAELFGKSQIIAFVTWFLQESIQYLYRKFTLEGQIIKLSTNIDKLDKQINLYKKLEEMMPEERYKSLRNEQKDALIKSGAIIAKRFQALLEKETKVKVNDVTYEIQKHEQNSRLNEGPKKLTE